MTRTSVTFAVLCVLLAVVADTEARLGAPGKDTSGVLPCWTYADDSGCLQTYTNYPAMWVTMKGTGIDTGHASSKIRHGHSTCADQGFTVKTDILHDLPGVVKAAYAGVTSWSKPASAQVPTTVA